MGTLLTGGYTEYLNLDTQGSFYYTSVNPTTGVVTTAFADIAVFTGEPGAFELVPGGCNRTINGYGGHALIAGLRLQPNTTYAIKVSASSTLSVLDPPTPPVTEMPRLAFTVKAAPLYNVTRFDDVIPAAATCDIASCSLREAINAANAAPGAILVPAGSYSMTPTTTNDDANADGDFDLQTSLSIYGAGMGQTIIRAADNDRAFDYRNAAAGSGGNGATNLLADLSLIGPGDPANGGTGTFTWGGGLLRARSNIHSGIAGLYRVELANGYSTHGSESGASKSGGGAQFVAHAQIIDSHIHGNTGFNGGGLAFLISSAPNEIRGTLINGNHATNSVASTTTQANGGGGIAAASPLLLINSTLANNTANSDGGGMSHGTVGNAIIPRSQIRNVTISGNLADADGDGVGSGGGLRISRQGGLLTYNSILHGNVTGTTASASDDCSGNVPTAASPWLTGYNLFGIPGSANAAGGCPFSVASNDQIGIDPLLGALADNGGLTDTFALTTGSPAVDSGDPAGCMDNNGIALATDQRGAGYARPAGMRCDVGAFERVGTIAAPQPLVLDPASDTGSSNSDNLTNLASPTIAGTCETSPANYTLTLIVDGAMSGSVACASVPFLQVIGPLADGTHAVTAYALDADGAPSPQSQPLHVTVDTQTNVEITSAPENPSFTAQASIEVTAEIGDTLMCTLDSGIAETCISPVVYSDLAAGEHTFLVEATDAAGNLASASATWTIVAPDAPSVPALDSASDSGSSSSDGITNAASLLFSGACTQDGDSIQLLSDASAVGTAATCAAGVYSVSIDDLAEGAHAINATTTRNGVVSTASASVAVVADRTTPVAPTVTGPAPPLPPTVTLNGTAEAIAMIAISQDGNASCATTADATGSWSCTVTLLHDAGNVLELTATDIAGNVSAVGSYNAEVDVLFHDGFDG